MSIEEGRTADDWKDNPAKLRQKGRDVRWTVKHSKAKPRETARLTSVWQTQLSHFFSIFRPIWIEAV